MRRYVSALTIAALAFVGVAAEDAEACRTVETEAGAADVCETRVWFHAAASPFANPGAIAGDLPTFDTTEPSSQGAGYITTSALHQTESKFDPAESATFVGTYEGAFDVILVDAYLIPPSGIANGEDTYRVDAQLTIDGEELGLIGDMSVPMDGSDIRHIQFGWNELYRSMVDADLDPAAEHEIQVVFHGTGIGTNAAMVVFDSPEVPSGMTFDPAEADEDLLSPAF